MHSSRMRTARSLIVSLYLVVSHACPPFDTPQMHTLPLRSPCTCPHCAVKNRLNKFFMPCTYPLPRIPPSFAMHTPPPSNHACSPGNHACPPATTHPPQQPCTPPRQPRMPPGNHAPPLQPCMPPGNHAPPQQPCTHVATTHTPL